MFNHTPLETTLPDLSTVTLNGKRHYTTPEGNVYPSVTTVLSVMKDAALDKWRKRVGEDEAKSISEYAARRGTDLHACLEDYIANREIVFPEDKTSRVRLMFNRLKPILKDVDNVVTQEVALYSDTLKIAGRCDLVALYKGIPSIIDFKSSTKAKKKEWILGYFIQATAYSLMFEELTGIANEQIVILMSGETDFSVQVFVDQRAGYIHQLKEVIERFRKEND